MGNEDEREAVYLRAKKGESLEKRTVNWIRPLMQNTGESKNKLNRGEVNNRLR